MRYFIALFLLLLSIHEVYAADDTLQAELVTNQGTFVLELYPDQAPITVANFLRYAREGFYDDTVFHRVIPDFMVQGGGYSSSYDKKDTYPPIQNEANNGLKNERGTVAMSRLSDPHSATSQFFVNINDNDFLDYKSPTATEWGYAVFARVVSGMDVVNHIQALATGSVGPFSRHAPLEPVILQHIQLNEAATSFIAPVANIDADASATAETEIVTDETDTVDATETSTENTLTAQTTTDNAGSTLSDSTTETSTEVVSKSVASSTRMVIPAGFEHAVPAPDQPTQADTVELAH